MDIAKRIAQFENMAQADPTNEMAHFSLGKAYADAGRHADAAASYLRCTELVPDMSKAYQLAGEAFVKAGEKDRAIQMFLRGAGIAAERGDRMPLSGMVSGLKSLGVAVPPEAEKALSGSGGTVPLGGAGKASAPRIDPKDVPEGMIVDAHSGRLGTKMPRAPFRGPVGEWIGANISAETWRTWIGQGTKVINELRLDLSRDKDQETYDQHMREFLGVPDEVR